MKIKDNLFISDKQLDLYFNDIEECVNEVKGHQRTLKVDEIKDRLKKVRMPLKLIIFSLGYKQYSEEH